MSCAVTKAFEEKRYRQTSILIELGFDNFTLDENGRNILHKSSFVDNSDRKEVLNLINQLIDKKSDLINCQDKFGKTCLNLCLENEYFSAVKLLLSKDTVDLTISDNNGYTALHLCSERGYTKLTSFIVKRMTKYRLSIDQRTKDKGMTALMIACCKGNFNIAKILFVEGKASMTMRDNIRFKNAKELLDDYLGYKTQVTSNQDFIEILQENIQYEEKNRQFQQQQLKRFPMRRCISAKTLPTYENQNLFKKIVRGGGSLSQSGGVEGERINIENGDERLWGNKEEEEKRTDNSNVNWTDEDKNKRPIKKRDKRFLDRPKTASNSYKTAQFHYVFSLYSDVCSTSYTTAFKVEHNTEDLAKKNLHLEKADKISSAKLKLQNLIKMKKPNTLFNTVRQLKTRTKSESTRHSSQSSVHSQDSSKRNPLASPFNKQNINNNFLHPHSNNPNDLVKNIWKKTLSLSSPKNQQIPHANLLKKIVKLRQKTDSEHSNHDENQADSVFD